MAEKMPKIFNIRRKYILIFILLFTFLFSCAEKNPQKPYTVEIYKKNTQIKSSNIKQHEQEKYKIESPKITVMRYKKSQRFTLNSFKKGNINIHFDNISLDEFIRYVAVEILKLSYISPVALPEKISIHIENATEKEILYILKELLSSLGYITIIDQNKNLLKIFPPKKEAKLYTSIGILTYTPKYLDLNDIDKFVKAFGFKEVKTITMKNKIILIGDYNTIYLLHTAIKKIDTAFDGEKYLTFIKTSMDADTLKNYIVKILSLLGYSQNRLLVESFPEIGMVAVITYDKYTLEEIKKWINLIENSSKTEEENIYVLRLNFLKAEEVANFLNKLDIWGLTDLKKPFAVNTHTPSQINNSQKVEKNKEIPTKVKQKKSDTKKKTTKKVSKGKIIADPSTNTLIIKATRLQFEVIKKIIDELDRVPKQVFIEMVVAEITKGDSFEYGLEALLKGFIDKYPFSVETSFGLRQTYATLTGFKGIIFGKNMDIRSILNFLASKTSLKVLSAPYILVKNLQEAKVEIGAEVPVITELMTTTSGGVPVITTSVQYRPTGIILKVRPIISQNNTVTLEIKQEVSDAIPNNLSPNVQSPIITKRSTSTTLVLKDGQIALLGGIIQHRYETNEQGLPIISDIPGIGYLFKSSSKKNSSTELIILLKVYVVNETNGLESIRDNTIEKFSEVKKLIRLIKKKHETDEK